MKKDTKIMQYIDENLANVVVSEQMHHNMMSKIMGGGKMKRKLSATLGFTLAMILIAGVACAVAYQAGLLDFLEHWGKEQAEKGHIAFWSIEDKYEFEEPWQELISTNENDPYRDAVFGLPDENDIKQDDARALAIAAIKDKFGEDAFDVARIWDREAIYFWDCYSGAHEWVFDFYSKAENDIFESFPYYSVRIDAKTGNIRNADIHADIIEGNYGREYIETYFGPEYLEPIDPILEEAFAKIDAKTNELNKKYGMNYFWPPEAWVELSYLKVELGILNEPVHGLPTEDEIQQNEAIAIATEAMMEKFGLTKENMDTMYAGVSFATTFPFVGRAWCVTFVPDTPEVRKEGTTESYDVALRADNGEIIDILPPFT